MQAYPSPSNWYCLEKGQGRPLVLLHGIGMSHTAWLPVLDILARERRVLAFDIAGFGRTPALPEPLTVTALVDGLRDSLAARGIHEPVDMAGNSMGGWLTLASACAGLARSAVCLSPAGLARHEDAPWHIRPIFDIARFAARRLPGISRRLLAFGPMRSAALAIPVSVRSHRMPAEAAARALEDFANAPGFEATYAIIDRVAGLEQLSLPLTIAFGRNDWILTGAMQARRGLPLQTRWLRPDGWGHVPMWDDPEGVARVILEGSR